MLVHRRLFSTTPAALAKRRQIAIQRKKANVARQAVLQTERSPANFDPIRGSATAFTRSLLTPAAVWSGNASVRDSLYFDATELSSIQAAVEKASHDRLRADPLLSRPAITMPSTDSLATGSTDQSSAVNSIAASEEQVIQRHLEGLSLTNSVKSENASRIVSLQNSNARTLRAYNTAHAIKEFGRTPGDTGSAEVQAAILTVRILAEATHIANNKKDVHGYRGFRGLVHQRQKILKYLRGESVERYYSCIERLGLTDQCVVREITM